MAHSKRAAPTELSAVFDEESIIANSPPRRPINSPFQSVRCKKAKNSKKHTILFNPCLPHHTTPDPPARHHLRRCLRSLLLAAYCPPHTPQSSLLGALHLIPGGSGILHKPLISVLITKLDGGFGTHPKTRLLQTLGPFAFTHSPDFFLSPRRGFMKYQG